MRSQLEKYSEWFMEFGFLVCLYSLNFNNGKSKKKVLERNDVILVISVPSLAACVEE